MFHRYFACGSLQRHVASNYRVSKASFCDIIDTVCNAICSEMQDEMPKLSKEGWLNIANRYNQKWNFPNCLGSIDGKHIPIKCPPNAGSLFFNYKVSSSSSKSKLFVVVSQYLLCFCIISIEVPQYSLNGRCGC